MVHWCYPVKKKQMDDEVPPRWYSLRKLKHPFKTETHLVYIV